METKNKTINKSEYLRVNRYSFFISIFWFTFIIASLLLNTYMLNLKIVEIAKSDARAHFNKDLAIRMWSAKHGGVYVPISEHTPSNPNLSHIKFRDIEKPDGTKLTLMNPAYIIRQIQEDFEKLYHIKGIITSLKPLNKDNKPDKWEEDALKKFEKGTKEVFELSDIKGKAHLRLIRPMITIESCLKCHKFQGYKVGDIRGGIGVSIPMTNLTLNSKKQKNLIYFIHFLTLLLGIIGILFTTKRIKKGMKDKKHLEAISKVHYKALKQEREMFITGSVVIFKWRNQENWPVEYVSANVKNMLGYSDDEFVDGSLIYSKLIHKDDIDRVFSEVTQGMESDDNHFFHEPYRLKGKNNKFIWIDDHTSIIRDNENNITHFLGYVIDITNIKTLEASLKTSEQKYKTVADFTNDWEYWENTDFTLNYVSPACKKITGYSPEEFINKPKLLLDIIVDEDKNIWKVHCKNEEKTHDPIQYRIKTKDNDIVWIEHVCQKAYSENKTYLGYRASNRDITERILYENEKIEMEKKIQHSQKLESLGILAGGIAHDFNNLLTAILGNADLAKKKLSPVSPSMKNIERVIETAHRAADLSNQMLAYSGKGRFVLEDISLSEIVEEMTHLLEVSISKKAIIKYEFAYNIPPIEGDATQIRQIIMNLITNASEAIGDRSGYISINTGVMDCDDNYISQCRITKDVKAGRFSYIEVADSGLGMSKTTIDKLFDPFFTTKFTGRGLGMSAVLGIIRGHNGTIKVYSEEKKGTTIKVLFPALDRTLDEINKANYKKQPDIENIEGTVLIADDEESVLSVASEMVEAFGLKVVTAKDGREALEIYRKNIKTIDLIILDLTMPRLDGEQAFRELRLINPDIPIIMSSGYNEQTVTQKFSGKRMTGFIQKPYRLDVLFNEIKKVLVKVQG